MLKERKKLLLVEDNIFDVELIMEALSGLIEPTAVQVARDGEEALDYLFRQGKFADRPEGNPMTIFLDLKMPKIDGMEVLRKIKTDETLRLIPIVAFSSSAQDTDLKEGYELGINAYIVKPVQFEEFLKTAREMGLFWLVYNQPPPGAKREERP